MASKNDDLFGGMFDFDGDGKTDIGEEFLAYMMFDELSKDEEKSKDDSSTDFGEFDDFDEDISDDDLDDLDEYDDDLDDGPLESEYISSPSYSSVYYSTPTQKVKHIPKVVSNNEKETQPGITLDGYKAARSRFITECISAFVVGLLGLFLPLLVIWAAISSYDEKNSASGFVVALFVIVGIIVIVAVIKAIKSILTPSWEQFKLSKMSYTKSASEDELKSQKSKKRRNIIIVFTIIGLALLSVIMVSIGQASKTASVYENAERLIESGDYQQAKEDLKGIEDSNYRDTAALILLCTAHIEYNGGRTVDAYYTLKDANFRYQTSAQQSKISSFRNTLDSEYKAYINRMVERQQQEYESKIVNGVPFVGMSESRIADTTLGKPSDKVRHNSEMINGQRYSANLYDFYQNGKLIFTARCIQGRVTEVWDERNKSTSTYTPKSGKSSTDPSVEGFSHPEDFYEYYWDDFFDYEDAEDYYYEHSGK